MTLFCFRFPEVLFGSPGHDLSPPVKHHIESLESSAKLLHGVEM